MKQLRRASAIAISLTLVLTPTAPLVADPASTASSPPWVQAAENGRRSEEMFRRTRRVVHAWLKAADPKTLLLPDYLPSFAAEKGFPIGIYRPHNSGADNYPYLILTAYLTDRALYDGRLFDMLRNEVRYTTVAHGIPGDLDLKTGQLGPLNPFGAAEWGKDGAIAVTELLGRTPWFYRMVDMTAAVMEQATVKTDFGLLTDAGAEVNGDMLQVMVRLAAMTGDKRYLEWSERIADAYIKEVLPKNHGLPGYEWDFAAHTGPDRLRLRDHGNEIIVGLVLLHALENYLGRERAAVYRPAIDTMLDRVLQSANPDGMFYNEIRCSDLQPLENGISDNWGYIYGVVYTHYMATGQEKYRDAVLRVLRNLPKYRSFDWEHGRQDGYADTIESTLYLIAREPVREAIDWMEGEMPTLVAFQKPDGFVEGAYPDGNWNRTLLLYALYKTQGAWVDAWQEGVQLGAVREGPRLYVNLVADKAWTGKLHLDFERHRRVLNFDRNYVRLNEWPEWYTVDENRLYRVKRENGEEQIYLGSQLKEGINVQAPLRWTVEPLS